MKNITITLAFLAIILISSCDRKIDLRPVPIDGDPAISLQDPASNLFQRTIGSTAEFTLQLADNEQLKILRVTESVFNADGDTLLLDAYKQDFSLDTAGVSLFDYSFPVPNQVQSVIIQSFYQIHLKFYAIDSKGASSSTVMVIDVVPDAQGPPKYGLLSYTDQFMLHPNNFLEKKGLYNFSTPGAFPTRSLDMDVKLEDGSPGFLKDKIWTSPSNDLRGKDSLVFVVTGPDKINYETCNWRIIDQNYKSAGEYRGTIPMPKVGDYVIVRLTKGAVLGGTHYALLNITKVGGASFDDKVEFDYKVSF